MTGDADNAKTSVIYGSWPAGTEAGTYFVARKKSGRLEVIGEFIVPANVAGTFAIPSALSDASTAAVYSGVWDKRNEADGTWSPGALNSTLTATLNYTHNIPSMRLLGAAQ